MKVRFGVSVISRTAFPNRRDLAKFAELIRIIDGSGVELIGTNDTSFIGGGAYVRVTLIAQTAKNTQVGIHPTNPLTREPQIMAAFMASIDAMTEGRAFVDIASGDSAVYNIGLAPASRARLADYVTCLRDLIATGEGTYAGRPQRVRWHGEAVRKRIPITLCAEGPKTLHLGGRLFDGVIAGTGLLPEVISDTIERVAAGAREAGRDPSEAEVWFTARSSLDADRDKAIERIHASVSSILNHSMRFGLEGKNVPNQFRAKIAEYVAGYELYDHVLQAGRNPKRMAELGLTEYALERFALVGNVNDWIERIGRSRGIGSVPALAQHGSRRPRPPDPLHEIVHRTDHAAFPIARYHEDIAELRRVTDEFVSASATVTANDAIYDPGERSRASRRQPACPADARQTGPRFAGWREGGSSSRSGMASGL